MKKILTRFWNTTARPGFILVLAVLALCSALLVACGDDNAGQNSSASSTTTGNSNPAKGLGPKIDPCTLVSQAEFDNIWGIKTDSAKEVESLSEGYDSSCDYDSEHLLVSLFVNRAGKIDAVTGKDNNAIFDFSRKYGKETVDIPNLGDKAMWDTRFEQLHVVKHNVMLLVNITEGKPDHSDAAKAEKQAKSITLARQALTRIP
jgi:hypothetical protein